MADLRAELESSPLYPTLEAVRTGQVTDVGTHWFSHGPIAARLVLGDRERRFA